MEGHKPAIVGCTPSAIALRLTSNLNSLAPLIGALSKCLYCDKTKRQMDRLVAAQKLIELVVKDMDTVHCPIREAVAADLQKRV